jgi:hypothetical protein
MGMLTWPKMKDVCFKFFKKIRDIFDLNFAWGEIENPDFSSSVAMVNMEGSQTFLWHNLNHIFS